jgi:hypothetical protein
MVAHLTLLSAAGSQRLAKEFTPDGATPYPLVKNVNSFCFETPLTHEGHQQRLELLQEHARFGYCMLKGPLTRELRNESRAGLTQRNALTRNIILDIDGYPLDEPLATPCTAEQVEALAEHIVSLLPSELHDVSYIAHASSSFGLKEDRASIHIEFLLSEEIAPQQLKIWLQYLNLSIESFADKLRLTPSGHAISWIIDPSVADNSKLIYIATPMFNGVDNPFEDDNERWVLVQKANLSVDLTDMVGSLTRAEVVALSQKKLSSLRKAIGLSARAHKTRAVTTNGVTTNVIANPDEMTVQLYRVTDDYAIFNVNGGDSNAYWCRFDNPDIIMNFKGEPPFQFSKADPEAYAAFIEEFGEQIIASNPIEPFVFRDQRSDTFYLGRYDRAEKQFIRDGGNAVALNPISKQNIEGALAEEGQIVPDTIPSYALIFNPQMDDVIDDSARIVNRFSCPELMRTPAKIDSAYQGIEYDFNRAGDNKIGAYINALTPNIHRLIFHILGNDTVCYEHFINWLAFAYQRREVSNTAWVFSGLPGTGKGLFFEHVIERIWSKDYASMKTMDNIEDAFNGSLESQLMVAFDEVHMTSSKSPERLMDDIKHMIGSSTGTVRAMRTEQRAATFYYNFMLFSNHRDAIRVEQGDRRFNVAPYQEVPIRKLIPDMDGFVKNIQDEVPMFAAFLMHFATNIPAARICLENAAKAKMRFSGMNSTELFFDACKTGKLDYFIETVLLHKPDVQDYTEVQRHMAAKIVIKTWIEDCRNKVKSTLPTDDLRIVYLALYPHQTMTPNKFGSMLSKNGMSVNRRVIPNRGKLRAIEVEWFIEDFDDEGSRQVIDGELAVASAAIH